MLICQERDCTCHQHQMLNSLNEKNYREVRVFLREIENLPYLTEDSKLRLLNSAVKYGIPELVKYLVELGWKMDVQDSNNFTPLMLAIRNGNAVGVQALLDNNADIYFVNRDGITNLDYVCHLCMSYLPHSPLWILKIQPVMEKFFEKVSNDFSSGKDEVKQLLLNTNDIVKLFTVVFGSLDLAKFMLANDYAVNDTKLPSKQTGLHCAIIFSKYENAKILIEHKANVNEQDHIACTPLYYYADSFQNCDEKSEVLEILLRYTNNVTQTNRLGISMLERLLHLGNKKTVKTLLENVTGIATMKFQFDKSLLHILVENNNAEVLNVFEELNIPFDVNARRSDGETALMRAANLSFVGQVKFLLKHNADVNLFSNTDESAVKTALEVYEDRDIKSSILLKDAAKIVVLLLQHGAKVHVFRKNSILFDRLCSLYDRGPSVNISIAHLSLLKALGSETIIDFVRDRCLASRVAERSFDDCRKQIQEMKNVKVYKAMTLFRILIEKPEKMANWVRNQEFLLAFNNTMEKNSHLQTYYIEALHWRIEKALDIVNLKNEAALIVEELTGFGTDNYYTVMSNIISYLSVKDLNGLIMAKRLHSTKSHSLIQIEEVKHVRKISIAPDLGFKISFTFLAHTIFLATHMLIFAKKNYIVVPVIEENILELTSVVPDIIPKQLGFIEIACVWLTRHVGRIGRLPFRAAVSTYVKKLIF